MPAIDLYDYQKKWMLDKSRFKCGMFARQTGKTFTTTLEVVDDCWEAEAQGKRARWVILSRGERQAKEAMNEGIKLHCKAYNMAFEAIEESFITPEGIRYNMLEVVLPNGSKITALPANPDTARGFSANVFLDEFAIHKDSREIWGALFPVISAGWKMRITSTPKGKGNKFYEIMTDKGKRWSRHIVDIYQAVADGLPRDIDELREGMNNPDLWAQEYELKWLDEASNWLSYDLINSVEDERAGVPLVNQIGEFYIGNDIAIRNDLWVAWALERVGDVLWTREIAVLKRASFYEQDRTMDEMVRRYNPVLICMDQTAIGEKPVEDAKRRYGDYRVEGVIFNNKTKHHLAVQGKEHFQDRLIRIPEGDIELREDLHSLKQSVTISGAPRFDAARSNDSHADRTWACFLAIEAAATPKHSYEYEQVSSIIKPNEDDLRDIKLGNFGTSRGVL